MTTAFFILVKIEQHITRTLSKSEMKNGYVVGVFQRTLTRGKLDKRRYSAIHKAAVQPATVQNSLWTMFCMVAPFDILGIVPGKVMEWPGTMRPVALSITLFIISKTSDVI